MAKNYLVVKSDGKGNLTQNTNATASLNKITTNVDTKINALSKTNNYATKGYLGNTPTANDYRSIYNNKKKEYDQYTTSHTDSSGNKKDNYSTWKAISLEQEANNAYKKWQESQAEQEKQKKTRDRYNTFSSMDDTQLGNAYAKAKAASTATTDILPQMEDGLKALEAQRDQIKENAGYAVTSEQVDEITKSLADIEKKIEHYNNSIARIKEQDKQSQAEASKDLDIINSIYANGRDSDIFVQGDRDEVLKNIRHSKAEAQRSGDTEAVNKYTMYEDMIKDGAEYDSLLKFDVKSAEKEIEANKQKIEEGNLRIDELRKTIAERELTDAENLEIQQIKRNQDIWTSENSQLRTKISSAKNAQEVDPYSKLINDEKFLQYAEEGDAIENEKVEIWTGADTQGFTTKGNMAKAVREEGTAASGIDDDSYLYMNDAEYAIYCGLLARDGEEEAEKYHRLILNDLNARKGYQMANNTKGLGTVALGAAAGLDQAISGIDNVVTGLTGGEVEPTSAMQYASGYKREQLADAGPKLTAGGDATIGQMAYDALVTTANMAPTIAISAALGAAGMAGWAAEAVSAATMGLSAGGNYYKEALDQGYSKDEAAGYAVLAGASESALQYVLGGISKLGGVVTNGALSKFIQSIDAGFYRASAELGIRELGEASEEYLQDVLTPVFYNLATGEKNTVELFSSDAAYSFMLALVTTGLLEGGNVARTNINAAKYGQSYAAFLQSNDSLLKEAAKEKGEVGELAKDMLSGKAKINDYNAFTVVSDMIAKGKGNDVVAYLNNSVVNATDDQKKQLVSNLKSISDGTGMVTIGADTQWLLDKCDGKNVEWADRQIKLIKQIANGVDLDISDIEDLDLDNKYVQAIFSTLTGVAIPESAEKSTAVALVNNTIKNIQEQKNAKSQNIQDAGSILDAKLKDATEKLHQNLGWGLDAAQATNELNQNVAAAKEKANTVKNAVTAKKAQTETVTETKSTPKNRSAVTAKNNTTKTETTQPTTTAEKFANNPLASLTQDTKTEDKAGAKADSNRKVKTVAVPEGYTEDMGSLDDFFTTNKGKKKTRREYLANAAARGQSLEEANAEFNRFMGEEGKTTVEKVKGRIAEKADEIKETAEAVAEGKQPEKANKQKAVTAKKNPETTKVKTETKSNGTRIRDLQSLPIWWEESFGNPDDQYRTEGKKRQVKIKTRKQWVIGAVNAGQSPAEANAAFQKAYNRQRGIIDNTPIQYEPVIGVSQEEQKFNAEISELEKAQEQASKDAEDFEMQYDFEEGEFGNLEDLIITAKGKFRSRASFLLTAEKRGLTLEEANEEFNKLRDAATANSKKGASEEKTEKAKTEKTKKQSAAAKSKEKPTKTEEETDELLFPGDEKAGKVKADKDGVIEFPGEETVKEKPKASEEKAKKQKAVKAKKETAKETKTEVKTEKVEKTEKVKKQKAETASASLEIPEGYTESMGSLDDVLTYKNGTTVTRRQWLLNGLKNDIGIEDSNAAFNERLEGKKSQSMKAIKRKAAGVVAKTAEKVSDAAKGKKAVKAKSKSTEVVAEANAVPEWYNKSMGDLNDAYVYPNGTKLTRLQYITKGIEKFNKTAEQANAEFNNRLEEQMLSKPAAELLNNKAADIISEKTEEAVTEKPKKASKKKTTAKKATKKIGTEPSTEELIKQVGKRRVSYLEKLPVIKDEQLQKLHDYFFNEDNINNADYENIRQNILKEMDARAKESSKIDEVEYANKLNNLLSMNKSKRSLDRNGNVPNTIKSLSDEELYGISKVVNERYDAEVATKESNGERFDEFGDFIDEIADDGKVDLSESRDTGAGLLHKFKAIEALKEAVDKEMTDRIFSANSEKEEVTNESRELNNENSGRESNDHDRERVGELRPESRKENNTRRRGQNEDGAGENVSKLVYLRDEQIKKNKELSKIAASAELLGIREVHFFTKGYLGSNGVGKLKGDHIFVKADMEGLGYTTTQVFWHEAVHWMFRTAEGINELNAASEVAIEALKESIPGWAKVTPYIFSAYKTIYDISNDGGAENYPDFSTYEKQRLLAEFTADLIANSLPSKLDDVCSTPIKKILVEEGTVDLARKLFLDTPAGARLKRIYMIDIGAAELLKGLDPNNIIGDVVDGEIVYPHVYDEYIHWDNESIVNRYYDLSDEKYWPSDKDEKGRVDKKAIREEIDRLSDEMRYRLPGYIPFKNVNRNPSEIFYSKMQRTVDQLMPNKMGSDQVVKWLEGKGIKAEEIKWSGIKMFLEGKKSVTREEVSEFLKANQFKYDVEVLDKKFGQFKVNSYAMGNFETLSEYVDYILDLEENSDEFTFVCNHRELDINEVLDINILRGEDFDDDDTIKVYNENGYPYDTLYVYPYNNIGGYPKYENFTESAHENYREILFKIPNNDYQARASITHWGNERHGIFAHARIDDRRINGKKVLFIEEIQSDWHNEGASKGFYSEEALTSEKNSLEKEIKALREETDSLKQKVEYLKSHYPVTYRQRVGAYDAYTDYRSSEFADMVNRISEWIIAHPDEKIPEDLSNESEKAFQKLNELKAEADELYETYRKHEKELNDTNTQYVKKFREVENLNEELLEIDRKIRDANNGDAWLPPNIPFAGTADTYHEFVMKYLTRIAAENGYDAIAWTSANAQSERWSIEYDEGYRIEYDQNIPKFMNKFGKQWGAKAEKSDAGKVKAFEVVPTLKSLQFNNQDSNITENDTLDTAIIKLENEIARSPNRDSNLDNVGYSNATGMDMPFSSYYVSTLLDHMRYQRRKADNMESRWSVDITPEMRESVVYEGMPLYKMSDVVAAEKATGVDISKSLGEDEQELYQAIIDNNASEVERILTEWVTPRSRNQDRYVEEPPVSAKTLNAVRKKQQEYAGKYGPMRSGEKAYRDVVTAKRTDEGYNRKHLQTYIEAEQTPTSQANSLELLRAAVENATYQRVSNADAIAYAEDKITRLGFERCVREWDGIAGGDGRINKNTIALGETLYLMAAHAGKRALANKIALDVAIMGTEAGQTVQAMSMLKRMSPAGKLYYTEKAVERINKDLKTKDRIEIDAELREALLNAETEEEAQEILNQLTEDLAAQIPSTFKDKWNSWRYFAMLGNPRTHIRNVLGNAVFAPIVMTKNALAFGMEQAFVKKENRTKSYNTAAYKDFANSVFAEYADTITGDAKYSVGTKNDILSKRKIWGKAKFMEASTNFVTGWLEREDAWFLRPYFTNAFSGFLEARGVKVEDLEMLRTTPKGNKIFNQAVQYATNEAQKATYRDASIVAQELNRFKNVPVVGWLLDGLLPFTKTPVNILKRGIEYSPVGIITAVGKAIKGYANGTFNSAEFVDALSAGLTGTGVAILGYFLANAGLLRGGDEEDEKEAQSKEAQGYQNYSITLDFNGTKKNFTIDWMAPASLPLFIGVAAHDLITNDLGELTSAERAKYLMKSATFLAEPMMQLSMLDGLNQTLSSLSYKDDTEMVSTLAINMATSYAGQAIPTLLGQITRTFFDDTRRSSYVDKNSAVPEELQYFIQSNIMGKIPVWEGEKIAYIDKWGRRDTESNLLVRFAENFLSPGYVNTITTTAVDEELDSLFEKTGDNSVYQSKQNKYFNVDGERKDLTAEEYEKLLISTGDTAYETLVSIINSRAYKNATDEEKVEMISDAYTYANITGRQTVDSRYEGGSQQQSFMDRCETYGADLYITEKDTISNLINGKQENRYSYMASSDELSAEQEAHLVIDAFDGSSSMNGTEVTSEQKTYQKNWFANNYTSWYIAVLNDSRYQQADLETKQDMLQALYQYVFELSKVEMSERYGLGYTPAKKYTKAFMSYFG